MNILTTGAAFFGALAVVLHDFLCLDIQHGKVTVCDVQPGARAEQTPSASTQGSFWLPLGRTVVGSEVTSTIAS